MAVRECVSARLEGAIRFLEQSRRNMKEKAVSWKQLENMRRSLEQMKRMLEVMKGAKKADHRPHVEAYSG